MPAYSSSDAQRPPAYVMSRIGSHGVDDRRGIIRFRDEPSTNNQARLSSSNEFSRIGVFSKIVYDILFLEIFKKKKKKKRNVEYYLFQLIYIYVRIEIDKYWNFAR